MLFRSTLNFFLDGARVATHLDMGSTKTYLPDVLYLTPTIVVQSLAGASTAETLNVDFVRAFIGGFRSLGY